EALDWGRALGRRVLHAEREAAATAAVVGDRLAVRVGRAAPGVGDARGRAVLRDAVGAGGATNRGARVGHVGDALRLGVARRGDAPDLDQLTVRARVAAHVLAGGRARTLVGDALGTAGGALVGVRPVVLAADRFVDRRADAAPHRLIIGGGGP